MKKHNIKILAFQETHIETNSRETRKGYTWYMSGENRTGAEWTAGTGFVIDNEYRQYIDDIIPISDKLSILTLNSSTKITLISTYLPQAYRPTDEKIKAYSDLNKEIRRWKSKGKNRSSTALGTRI